MDFKKFRTFSIEISIFALIIAHKISCEFDRAHYTCAVNYNKCQPHGHRPCCDFASGCQQKNDTFICLKKEDLGGACEENSDCFNIDNAVCSAGQCACKSDHINTAKNKCSRALGSFCQEPTFPCPIRNSRCIDNRCQCKADHIIIDHHQCEPITIGKSCKYNSEYVSHKFECSNDGIFVCKKHYTLNNKLCIPVSNGVCSEDNQCQIGFQCVNNKCQCKSGYTYISSYQCSKSEHVSSCFTGLDCSDPWHAMCAHGICVCTSNHVAINNSTCYPILGGYCWNHHQCLTINSECVDYHCQCKSDFVALSDNFCAPRTNSEIY